MPAKDSWPYPFSPQWLESKIQAHGTPLFVMDLIKLRERCERFSSLLPETYNFYAMKSLDVEPVIASIGSLGWGMDAASIQEMIQALQYVPANRIFYTHPYKSKQGLDFAKINGIRFTVFDNESELQKISAYGDFFRPFLRISIDNPHAVVRMHTKFGAALEEYEALFQKAEDLGLPIEGISFHVGSQNKDYDAYGKALEACQMILTTIKKKTRFHPLRSVNIGGGFPVDYTDYCISQEAELTYFKRLREVCQSLLEAGFENILSEPGRYISAPIGYGVSSVLSVAKRDGQAAYYIDDGLYGLYSGMLYDHAHYPITTHPRGTQGLLAQGDSQEKEVFSKKSYLFGISCDSIDVINHSIYLPSLSVGDIVIGSQMGAYTYVSCGNFNGLDKATCVYWEGE